MSENVVSLRGIADIGSGWEPDERVVAECERLVEMAKSGELRGIAYAVAVKRTSGENWTGYGYTHDDGPRALNDLLVATHRMRRKLENHMFADADD
jgi:hypothetical protein